MNNSVPNKVFFSYNKQDKNEENAHTRSRLAATAVNQLLWLFSRPTTSRANCPLSFSADCSIAGGRRCLPTSQDNRRARTSPPEILMEMEIEAVGYGFHSICCILLLKMLMFFINYVSLLNLHIHYGLDTATNLV